MIIGISGKINSGKDTVAKIIQYLTLESERHFKDFNFRDYNDDVVRLSGNIEDYIKSPFVNNFTSNQFKVKRFADKLKDIVCILINCTREQLEDREFKEKPLGEEWIRWRAEVPNVYRGKTILDKLFNSEQDAMKFIKEVGWNKGTYRVFPEQLTPRLLLQLLGTNCGRDIIHPNIWVNALMSEYKADIYNDPIIADKGIYDVSEEDEVKAQPTYPNWLIPDVRFENEAGAILDKEGILIRVERTRFTKDNYEEAVKYLEDNNALMKQYTIGTEVLEVANDLHYKLNNHPSETALDGYGGFDYLIHNNGSIGELVSKVEDILLEENLIK